MFDYPQPAKPFDNIQGMPKINIVEVDDWTAIFVDDQLVYWHDSPCLEDALDILGIPNTLSFAENMVPPSSDRHFINEALDQSCTFSELLDACQKVSNQQLQSQISTLEAELARLREQANTQA